MCSSDLGYSMDLDPETSARAIGKDLRVSYKNSIQVCHAVRGMPIEDTKKYLEKVMVKAVQIGRASCRERV